MTESEAKVTIEDLFRTAKEMDDHYNPVGYGGHPVLTRECWRHEVSGSSTLLGYWDWVVSELDTNLDVWAEDLHEKLNNLTPNQMREWIIEDHIEAVFDKQGETYIRNIVTEGLTGLKDMTPQQLLKECHENGLLARHDIIEE